MQSNLVLWNAQSARAEQASAIRRDLSRRAGVIVRETASAERAMRLATSACREGIELVTAAGGDGTVSAAANGMLASNTNVPLAVLPLGATNNFAQAAGVPTDFDRAIALMTEGAVRPVDLLEMEMPKSGVRCLVNSAVLEPLEGECAECSISFEDGAAFETPLRRAVVVNGRHLPWTPLSDLEDGRVDVVVNPDCDPDATPENEMIQRRVRSFRLQAQQPLRLIADGEASIARLPIRFTARQGALLTVVGDGYPR